MGFFKDLFSGRKPEIKTQTVIDTQKESVANPLASFLSTNIGKGVPRFEGTILPTVEETTGASVNPFLSKTVESLFGDIKDTATKTFKNTYSDLLESSAGALSSSGRAYNDMNAITNLSLGLAKSRSDLELALPTAQYDIASKQTAARQAQANLEANAQYQDWMKSLPEYNPILDKAINYLNNQVSSGTTVLSALDPGQTPYWIEVLKGASTVAAAAASSTGTSSTGTTSGSSSNAGKAN